MSAKFLFFYLVLANIVAGLPFQNNNKTTFRAAVFEHAVTLFPPNSVVTRQKALGNMMLNLKEYKRQAELAGDQGVDILVFPENGIFGLGLSREDLAPYLENIIDPEKEVWNPCEDPQKHPNTEVQQYLSCLAKNNSLYIVANFGDRQPCDESLDPNCQVQYQLNTDVVYDKRGVFVAKYHKINLYFEKAFDFPPVDKAVTFDTPFGVFALAVCFDVLYYDPLVDLITNHGVRNVAFPTAWMDSLPFLAAIEFHSAFAAGLGVNFLAANINYPPKRFHGSGIYSPQGAKQFVYNDQEAAGKLLISDLPVIHKQDDVMPPPRTPTLNAPQMTEPIYRTKLHYDLYNITLLSGTSGHVTVCHRSICCQLNYIRDNTDEVFAFGAFDGLHGTTGRYYMYLQVCTLLKCSGNGSDSCGVRTKNSKTLFHSVHITGYNFTAHIYPEVLLTRNGSLALSVGRWKYNNGVLNAPTGFEAPLVATSLYGRLYSINDTNGRESWYPINRDKSDLHNSNHGQRREYCLICLIVTYLFTLTLAKLS
ncbi:pantetheinase-like [Pecten maximus]|uniref:pantetheinase-like n=1 Tax=Pecten maximus TaxID=6579 RepID=UPI0014585D62|nr:pantetheinase-like [Pecten maximus]